MAVNAAMPLAVDAFLAVRTSPRWVRHACRNLPQLLNDHANCELKAASTALGLVYRYADRGALVDRMSRLAREELRHFEQVRAVMAEWGIAFERLSASRYAGSLRDVVRRQEPERLLDLLLVGALIEARSCERFAALVPVLPKAMSRFYAGLLASEARHFDHYLQFARTESGVDSRVLDRRLDELRDLEAQLITADDTVFRFHSGMPNPPAIETES